MFAACGRPKNLRNQVLPVCRLLETTEGHLGAGEVLLGVLKVVEEGLVLPGDAGLLVGVGVGVAVNGTALAAEEAVQGGADLVAAVLLNGVALSTSGGEELGSLLNIAWRSELAKGLYFWLLTGAVAACRGLESSESGRERIESDCEDSVPKRFGGVREAVS